MSASSSAPATLRSSHPGPLLSATPAERRATAVAVAAGLAAAGWVWTGSATRDMDELVRFAVGLPAFAMGFGGVMLAMAAASDLRRSRQR